MLCFICFPDFFICCNRAVINRSWSQTRCGSQLIITYNRCNNFITFGNLKLPALRTPAEEFQYFICFTWIIRTRINTTKVHSCKISITVIVRCMRKYIRNPVYLFCIHFVFIPISFPAPPVIPSHGNQTFILWITLVTTIFITRHTYHVSRSFLSIFSPAFFNHHTVSPVCQVKFLAIPAKLTDTVSVCCDWIPCNNSNSFRNTPAASLIINGYILYTFLQIFKCPICRRHIKIVLFEVVHIQPCFCWEELNRCCPLSFCSQITKLIFIDTTDYILCILISFPHKLHISQHTISNGKVRCTKYPEHIWHLTSTHIGSQVLIIFTGCSFTDINSNIWIQIIPFLCQ